MVVEYAEPLPVLVVAELLGVPTEPRRAAGLVAGDRADVRGRADREVEDAAVRAAEEFAATVREPARERCRRPRATTWSATWSRRAHLRRRTPARLTEDEVVASAVLLLNAGHEASVNVFGNGLVAIPGAACAPTRGAPTCKVEEMLRFDPALQLFERTATADVTVGGSPSSGGRRSRCCSAPRTATPRP